MAILRDSHPSGKPRGDGGKGKTDDRGRPGFPIEAAMPYPFIKRAKRNTTQTFKG
jgi:hypothetical protein